MEQIPIEEATVEQVDMSKGDCDPQRFLARSVGPWREELTLQQAPGRTCRGTTLDQHVPEELHPIEGTHAEAACEELQPVARTHAGEVCRRLSPMGKTPCWRNSERNPPAKDTKCYELTAAPVAFLMCCWDSVVGNLKVKPKKKGEVRGRCLITNEINFPKQSLVDTWHSASVNSPHQNF